MRIFKKILVLLVLMVILFYGKEVYAAEKYNADDYIFFDPISTNTCNEKNYWTYYNQNTTCFRFMVLNNNDNTTNTTIKLLLDHDLGADTFANYKTVLNNNTANWTRQSGSIDIPDENTIASIMKLGSNRPTLDNISINGGITLTTLYTNTENYINGKLVTNSGYWVKGTVPEDDTYAYSVTQYGNNRLVPKTYKRGIRPMITVDKSLLKKMSDTNITSKVQNGTEYKYSYFTEQYGGYTYKQMQGFTVTNDNLVFYSSNNGNPDNGLVISYKGNNFSTLRKKEYGSTGHGNGMTFIPDENKVLVVGPNGYKDIYEYDGTTLTKTKTYTPDITYSAIAYDDYNKKIIAHYKRRVIFLDRNFKQENSFDLTHIITGQDFEYNNGYIYAVAFEAGTNSTYQLYAFDEAFSAKVYVIDARLKSDGTPDKDFGRVVKILYVGNIKRDGLDGTGELEGVSFKDNKMWFGYAAQHYDKTNTYKFYTINAKDVAVAPTVKVTYKVDENYTKATITSNAQLHTLSGWTLSADKYSLSKNFSDVKDASSVTVCDNYSNCTTVDIKELKTKKQTVTFSTLDVSKPFSAGTYTLKATTNGDGTITYKSSNENIATVDANGKVTFKKIGEVDISAVASKTDNYYQATSFYTLRITKDNQELNFESTQVNKKYGDGNFTVSVNHPKGDGEVTYNSSNVNVASVNNSGNVTINGAGTTTITATATETDSYASTTASYSLNVVPNAQELRFDTSTVNKKFGDKDFTIEVNQITGNGGISFKSSNTNVATVDANGKVTIKGVGSAVITATAAATTNYDESSASYSINVAKGEQVVEVEKEVKDQITKTIGDKKFSIKAALDRGDGIITYLSSNEKVATVDEEGNVTIVGVGDVILSINISETDNYEATIKSISLRVNDVKQGDDILEDIPNTAKETPFKTIRNILSFFLIFLGVTYIIRKKPIFEK